MAKTMSLARSKCGFLAFTTLEKVWKEKEKYFSDNVFRIRVEITVISETSHRISNDLRRAFPLKMDSLAKDFSQLLGSSNLADVTITCGSQTFMAHKQILAGKIFWREYLKHKCQQEQMLLLGVKARSNVKLGLQLAIGLTYHLKEN